MACKSFTLNPLGLIILLCSLLSYSLVQGANRVYCDPDNRPDTCEEDSNPVCGTAAGCTEGICKYDLPNPCVACRDPTISYYTQGTCEYSCKDFEKSLDCAKEWLTPVCGMKRNSCGKSISKSFDNACAACKIGKATSYTIGVCKSDGGIQCSSRNRNINCLEGYTHPVCGLTRKGCNDSSCRKTFGDSCSACDDSTVKLYVDGICPGDQSVSCDDQNRPTSCSDIVPEEMVCGIFGPECTSGCLKGYPTACKACQDPRVSGYFPGGCD